MARKIKLNKKNIIIGAWVVFIIFFIFIVANGKNMITGYSTYQRISEGEYSIEEYGKEVSGLSTEIQILDQEVNTLSTELESKQSELQKSNMNVANLNKSLELTELETNKLIKDYDLELGILNSKLEKAQKDIEKLKDDYSDLVENVAESVCCKEKIDNPNIDGYRIYRDMIICSEKEGMELDCSFD